MQGQPEALQDNLIAQEIEQQRRDEEEERGGGAIAGEHGIRVEDRTCPRLEVTRETTSEGLPPSAARHIDDEDREEHRVEQDIGPWVAREVELGNAKDDLAGIG